MRGKRFVYCIQYICPNTITIKIQYNKKTSKSYIIKTKT